MEQPTESTEAAPSFLHDFVQKLEAREKKARLRSRELHEDPGMKNFFTSNGAERIVREGNFSDVFRLDIEHKMHVAEHLTEEFRKGEHLSKEDFYHEKTLAKLMAFYKKQSELFRLYAEARDDEKLQELAVTMENEMPFLKEIHQEYMEEFADNAETD